MFRYCNLWCVPISAEDISRALRQLGVTIEQSNDAQRLKKIYLDLVRQNHPDTGGDQEKMKNITSAYELLRSLTEHEKSSFRHAHFRKTDPYRPKPSASGFESRRSDSPQSIRYHGERYRSSGFASEHSDRHPKEHSNTYYHSPYQPFGGLSPIQDLFFSRRPFRRFGIGDVFWRAFVGYLLITTLLSLIYRSWREANHWKGWDLNDPVDARERIRRIEAARALYRQNLEDIESKRRRQQWEMGERRSMHRNDKHLSPQEKRRADFNRIQGENASSVLATSTSIPPKNVYNSSPNSNSKSVPDNVGKPPEPVPYVRGVVYYEPVQATTNHQTKVVQETGIG